MKFDKVLDHGGERETTGSGACREKSVGKGRPDLLPPYPLMRLAQHYANGAVKYGDRNWEKGLPLARFIESAYRHLLQFMAHDRSEDHLAAVLWNVAGYVHTEHEIQLGRLPGHLAEGCPWTERELGPIPTDTKARTKEEEEDDA